MHRGRRRLWSRQTVDASSSWGRRPATAPFGIEPITIEPITDDVTGLLVGEDTQGDAIYITGDTVWCEGVAEVARRSSPALVIIFAGSAQPRGRFHVTMDANDAIETATAYQRRGSSPSTTRGDAISSNRRQSFGKPFRHCASVNASSHWNAAFR